MLKGLTRAGLGQAGTFEEFVRLAAKHGFDAVDAGGEELAAFIDEKGEQGARDFLREIGIRIGAIGLPVQWRTTDEEFKKGLARLAQYAGAASVLGCTACVTYILPTTDFPSAQFMAKVVTRLRTCARILGAYGIRLGLEYVGPHHMRKVNKNPFIWDLPATLELIEAIGENNVGLLLDSIHWHTTSNDVQELKQLTADQVVHVHINDAKNVPVEQVLDNDRLYPGEGVIRLQDFLRALHEIGYRGPVSQEVLTQQPPEEAAEILAAKSAQAFAKIFASL